MYLHVLNRYFFVGLYQWLHKKGYLTKENGKTILHRSAIASALSGAAGAFLGSPLFLVKTQLQSQAAEKISVGTQHGHKGAFAAFKSIYKKDGVSFSIKNI